MKVTYGWQIEDQAMVISGLHFGQSYLKGKSRSGRVESLIYHNLLTEDIIFHGQGKNTLAGVLDKNARDEEPLCPRRHPSRHDDREFDEDEYGSGGLDDVIKAEATEKDIVRNDCYVYEKMASPHEFKGLTISVARSFINLIPSGNTVFQILNQTAMDTGVAVVTVRDGIRAAQSNGLHLAVNAKDVIVQITGKKQGVQQPVFKHTHAPNFLAGGRDHQGHAPVVTETGRMK